MAVTWRKIAYELPIYTVVGLTSGTYANTSNAPVEVVNLYSSVGAVDFTNITGEIDGLIKVLVATDANVTVKHNAAKIKLRGAEDLPLNSGDVLGLVSIAGVWIEMFRSIF